MASNLSKKRTKVPGGKKVTNQSNKKHTLPLRSKPLVQTNIFNEIRLHKSKKPVTNKKRLRPYPEQIVTCPICSKQCRYIVLFDHVTRFHKDHNAKMVLAQFNRDFENS